MAPQVVPDEEDTYRREVEQQLGAAFEELDDADVEGFFGHVTIAFERGEAVSECARRWLAMRPR